MVVYRCMLQTVPQGLRAAARRGLVSVLVALARKCPLSHLARVDERGLALLHHAALYNRAHIVGALVTLGVDVNARAITGVYGAGQFMI